MERAGQTQQTEEIFTQACRHINKGRQKVMNLYLTFLWEYSSRHQRNKANPELNQNPHSSGTRSERPRNGTVRCLF